MAYCRVESSRLRYHKLNQRKLRADLYKNLQANVNNENRTGSGHGRRVILNSTFTGSPRWYKKRNYESLAIARVKGKPHLFITMTCNPRHPFIVKALPKGCKAQDRPDIVARVFKQQVEELKKQLLEGQVLGWPKAKALIYVVEFQKRGLPHVHVLCTLNLERGLGDEDIETYCCAEIPQTDLREHVLKYMIHNPCGEHNPRAPCLNDRGQCCHRYPKEYVNSVSYFNDDNQAVYMRRSPDEGGSTAEIPVRTSTGRYINQTVTNEWVVPYNPYLLEFFECHINVELVTSIKAIKYLLWYPFKGSPRAMVSVDDPENEITTYEDMRSISSSEGIWRIFRFDLHERYPSVMTLNIHLQGSEQTLFDDEDDLYDVVNNFPEATHLTAFYQYNADNPNGPNCNVKYIDFPSYYTFTQRNKTWKPRSVVTGIYKEMIGRLPIVSILHGDVWYLRLLLTHDHCKGKTSETDLRTVFGTTYDTCKEACYELGILQDDNEWRRALSEIEFQCPASTLRELFCMIVTHNNPSDIPSLFDEFYLSMSEDFNHRFELQNGTLSQHDRFIISLYEVTRIVRLHSSNNDHALTYLPKLNDDDNERALSIFSDLLNTPQLQYALDNEILNKGIQVTTDTLDEYANRYKSLTVEQREFVDNAEESLEQGRQIVYFLNAFAGTGKTFTLNTLIARAVLCGKKVKAAAFTGIASILILYGSTFHSQFRAPLEPNEDDTLNIGKRSQLAKDLQVIDMIVIDECVQLHKYFIEMLDRTLRDLTDNDTLFGGKSLVLGGDWRQTLPIIPRASEARQMSMCIKNSYIWEKVRLFNLTRNIRVQSIGTCNEARHERMELWKQQLLQIGNGTYPQDENGDITLPERMCITTEYDDEAQMQEAAIKEIYGDLIVYHDDMNWMCSRSILCPHIKSVNEINKKVTDQMPTEEIRSYSADRVTSEEEEDIPIEFLNSLDISGLPKHELILKKGMPVLLMRNLRKNLPNGTKLIVDRLQGSALLLDNPKDKTKVALPRIDLEVNVDKFGFKWRRRQFPIQAAFAMTINKSQGQTLEGKVGVYLHKPVFQHGQLYVAASRATDPDNLKFIVPKSLKTKNIVFRQML